MAFENEKKRFQQEKNSRICAVHFTEDYFRENLAIRRFLGSDFRPQRLNLKEDAVPRTIFFCSEKKSRGRMSSEAHAKTPLSVRLLLNEGS